MNRPVLRTSLPFALVSFLAVTGCRKSLPAADCASSPPSGPGQSVCTVPGWDNRDFILRMPSAADGKTKLPVVIALHGGGGRKEGFGPMTCADGDETSPSCIANVADKRGFVLVIPDGTEKNLNIRTWNAGGDAPGLACVYACAQGIDDTSYFRALIAHVERLVPIDEKRIFVTGFSDGASMSNRLGCELADTIAAIAPVGGANQFALSHTCSPARPIPVLHTHGKADPCWLYAGGQGTCPGQPDGDYADVLGSVVGTADKPGWAIRNGCSAVDMPTLETMPDMAADGMTSTRQTFTGCSADVEHIAVEGAGHTWPGGDQYLGADTIGKVTLDFSASEEIFDFFESHPMP